MAEGDQQAPDETASLPVAHQVLILLGLRARVSRNDRAKWFLDHVLRPIQQEDDDDEGKPMLIASVLDKDGRPIRGQATLDGFAHVRFVPRSHRLAFVVDYGPSALQCPTNAAGDWPANMMAALRTCLTSAAQPFHPPGREDIIVEPKIHVAVTACGTYIGDNTEVKSILMPSLF